MINEQDFDVAASDICDRVVMISDPQLVVTVEKWLSKLTLSENRGTNELNYLKLLQYMVANKRIGRPFVREPPFGPLLPLSRYINPPSCSRLLVRRKSRAETGWRTVSCTRASQTVEQDYDDFDDYADYYGGSGTSQSNNGSGGGASQLKNGDGGSTSLSKNGDSGASLSKNGGSGASLSKNGSDGGNGASLSKNGSDGGSGASLSKNGSDGGSGASLSKNGDQNKDAVVDNDQKTDDANGMKETTFDGHLAGGECDSNWGPTKCGGGERDPAKNIDQMAEFCNPCLDNLGRYKKHVHEPMDATYRNLLGDCAFPVFTEAERNSASPELFDILNNVNDSTTLHDFYCQVSLYTCDQGELLMRVSNGMLDEFRVFVTDVFESRTEHISDGLAKEQMLMNDKYTYLEHRTLNRATVALDFLREAVPVFDWYKYRDGADAYLKRLVLSWHTPSAAAAAAAASGDADDVATAGGADDGEDKTDVRRSAALKKLLYTLNRQRSDATRAECEGKRLYEQRDGLLAALAESNAKLSAAQCQWAADVDRLKDQLALLQRQTADQTSAVDQLMEATQLAVQNKKHSLSPSASCR